MKLKLGVFFSLLFLLTAFPALVESTKAVKKGLCDLSRRLTWTRVLAGCPGWTDSWSDGTHGT